MLLTLIEQFVTELNGRRHLRLPFWNACDDDPKMDHAVFSFILPKGEVVINAYELKKGVTWSNGPCSGDSFFNRFAATLFTDGKIVPITGFVDIHQGNLEKFLGQFRIANSNNESTTCNH